MPSPGGAAPVTETRQRGGELKRRTALTFVVASDCSRVL